jgi:hypothetical protein
VDVKVGGIQKKKKAYREGILRSGTNRLPVGAGGPFRQTQKSGKRGKEEEKEEGKKKEKKRERRGEMKAKAKATQKSFSVARH